jgi:hypothetical protein
MNPAHLARAFRAAAAELEAIDAEERAERRNWSDQATSPLGRRRHVAAVRRRLATGQPGAAFLGRRALLSAEAQTEELANLSTKPAPKAESFVDSVRRELRMVQGR